jgi:hypothetical protein
MRPPIRAIACWLLIPALCLTALPAVAGSPDGAARLEGRVLGVDGFPASGYRIHLVGGAGADLGRSEVDEKGIYSFPGLAPGAYSLGVESPEGLVAPVASPPIQLGARELARRDIKLMEADAQAIDGMLAANPSLGAWWGERTLAAKIWTVVGIVAIAGVTSAALDDDDEDDGPFEDEEDTSPIKP